MSKSLFYSVTLEWNYNKGEVRSCMSDYLPKLLQKVKHQLPIKSQYSPHPALAIIYRAKISKVDKGSKLDSICNNLIRKIVSTVLYIRRFINMTTNKIDF